ncbi:MAG: transketolase [Syntrophorhabdales bacterium]|jgi:transketolase
MSFESESLTGVERARLEELARQARSDIVTMTCVAGSGHPGGSLSSLETYLVVFSCADLSSEHRDRIVVSHGHTSPGVYASLARLGHLPVDEVVAFFRRAGSPYEGHVVRGIPFIDWSTGNLGQGLSAGCGLALAGRVKGEDFHVYVLMSDGEQAKGQVAEARRFTKKYGLSNITVVIDVNGIQISGKTDTVMPVNIKEGYIADGWDVMEVDGHDVDAIYRALRKARNAPAPVCIVARTIIGKGIPFMEGKAEYHGRPLNQKEMAEAAAILGVAGDRTDEYRRKRKGLWEWRPPLEERGDGPVLDTGAPSTYTDADKVDNRTAFGKALKDLGEKNIPMGRPVCVFDCDLASSVKSTDFAKVFPDHFFQGGVQEHNTATVSGALSSMGVVTFFADFGAFGMDETYNQQRLNDINRTNLKLVLTHLGLDVGQDGKTHQCIDYIGLARNLYHFRTIVPADPNQVDRAVRYAAGVRGNFVIGTGRSQWPVIRTESDSLFFANGYRFVYGRMDVIRSGEDGAIITYGGMVDRALRIRAALLEKRRSVAVINMACVTEVDEETMKGLLGLPYLFTYEDHNPATGIGPTVAAWLVEQGYGGRMARFGVKDYGLSGDTEDILKAERLDVDSMVEALWTVMK